MKQALFFIHGGPGFNNVPEQRVLGPLLAARNVEACFWNEPSPARPQGRFASEPQTFANWLRALEAEFLEFAGHHPQVHVVGFSFGSQGAAWLAAKHADRVGQVSLFSPALDLHSVFKNICELSVADFALKQPEKARRISGLLKESRQVMDPPLEQAFQVALENEGLLAHYWQDRARMDDWIRLSSGPGAQFDLGSFFGVSRTFSLSHLPESQVAAGDRPVNLYFGTRDPIVKDPEREAALAGKCFRSVRRRFVEGAGHFVHLERPVELADALTASS